MHNSNVPAFSKQTFSLVSLFLQQFRIPTTGSLTEGLVSVLMSTSAQYLGFIML